MNTQICNSDVSKVELSQALLTGKWLGWLMFALAALSWIASATLIARGIGIEDSHDQFLIALAGLAPAGFLFLLAKSAQLNLIQSASKIFPNLQAPSLPALLLLGLTLRLTWVWIFPAEPTSDGASYLGLAEHLLASGRYEIAGTLAYWPPGYPFFLAPWLLIFSPALAILISQLWLYVIGTIGCYKLSKFLSGDEAARIAALLFTLWPNLIALSGTPEKETLPLALLPWICLGVIKPDLLSKVLAGLALGLVILVQPSFQFLPIAFLFLIPMLHGWRSLRGALFLLISAAIVIAPWTLRNQQQFSQFVLISTNGGDNLYRANNPLASGGYTEKGAIDFSEYSEVEHDHVAKQQAIEWIIKYPGDFLKLAWEKQIRFMGDDSTGVFNTLKRGRGPHSSIAYVLCKLIANVWWILIWIVISLLAWSSRTRTQVHNMVVWWWFYLFALHSIFESSGKYHIPVLWVLCVWLGGALTAQKKGLS